MRHYEKFVYCERCLTGEHLQVVNRTDSGAHQNHTDELTAVYECIECGGRGKLILDMTTREERVTGSLGHVNEL